MCIYERHVGISSVTLVDLIQNNISRMQKLILPAQYFAIAGFMYCSDLT